MCQADSPDRPGGEDNLIESKPNWGICRRIMTVLETLSDRLLLMLCRSDDDDDGDDDDGDDDTQTHKAQIIHSTHARTL